MAEAKLTGGEREFFRLAAKVLPHSPETGKARVTMRRMSLFPIRYTHKAKSTMRIRRQAFKTLRIYCELLLERVRFVLWDPVLSKRRAVLQVYDASTVHPKHRKAAALLRLSPFVW